jgi:hypothetical protein
MDTDCPEEVPYDGIDQDCDGSDLTDVDGDGFDAIEAGGEDCRDGNAAIHPDAEEDCATAADEDCDSVVDEGCAETVDPGDPGGFAWSCSVSAGVGPLPLLVLFAVYRRSMKA